MNRLRIDIEGAVQGVGFRPFVYRLADELGLPGWVFNDTRGVSIEVQGTEENLARFVERLRTDLPSAAEVERLTTRSLPPRPCEGFEIRASAPSGTPTAQMLPDIATCDDCLAELLDPSDRRFRYPFTNCTHCGPRLSIIVALPYDRSRTTMKAFPICADCLREYEDPSDRRFHAQPNACSVCGPRLELRDTSGKTTAWKDEALVETARALAAGEIVAVKGLGGFHLMLDARNPEAIARLRTRKTRREKPLAVMARDLDQARGLCRLEREDELQLGSAICPILLVPRCENRLVHEDVAPGSSTLGLMLPYTPLHHLLLRELDGPVVATSGNLSDEPICTDEDRAVRYLEGIADRFLVHDRPIARPVDDSIVRRFAGTRIVLRRARGFAPRPILVRKQQPSILAVGAHLKNAVAVSVGRRVFVSQHIGDMETPESVVAFERIVDDFLDLYSMQPTAMAHDLHPGYVTTRWCRDAQSGETGAEHSLLRGLPLVAVQHHHAHLASCLADNEVDEEALGMIWDGTGHGEDGTVWGGECLIGDASGYRRVGHLRQFSLPGGEAAVREPRRAAAALLWELHGEAGLDRGDLATIRAFDPQDRTILARMLARGINTPRTSSMGRLFDAVASLLDLHQTLSFEGQAAMALEQVADPSERSSYSLTIEAQQDGGMILNWAHLIEEILEELHRGIRRETIAARFHNALVNIMLEVARRSTRSRVALSGGCFQNRLLTERAAERLGEEGFDVLLHRRVPPNDGGIALGQLSVAASRIGAPSFRSPR